MKIKTMIESLHFFFTRADMSSLATWIVSWGHSASGKTAAGVCEVQQLRPEWFVCSVALELRQVRLASKQASLSVSLLGWAAMQGSASCKSFPAQHWRPSQIAPILPAVGALLCMPKDHVWKNIYSKALKGTMTSLVFTFAAGYPYLSRAQVASLSAPHNLSLGVFVSTELVSGQLSWDFPCFPGLSLSWSVEVGKALGFGDMAVWFLFSPQSHLTAEFLSGSAHSPDRPHGIARVGPIPCIDSLQKICCLKCLSLLRVAFEELMQKKEGQVSCSCSKFCCLFWSLNQTMHLNI